MIRGTIQYNAVSEFVREIPPKLLDNRPPSMNRSWDEDEYDFDDDYNDMPVPIHTVKPVPIVRGTQAGGFKMTPLGGVRPKAVPKVNKTPDANKPYISKSLEGLTKGVPTLKDGKLDYGMGDRVTHVKYGVGTVVNIAKEPKDFKVTVDFDGYGKKIMYAGFAKLEKI
jgi:DNA helicase-2/ATP-dependent DNA helicase PcrA